MPVLYKQVDRTPQNLPIRIELLDNSEKDLLAWCAGDDAWCNPVRPDPKLAPLES